MIALHTWPQFWKAPQKSFSATASGLTSSSTIAASLPPSSSVMRLRSGAAEAATFLPVSTEPVKEILRGTGCDVIQAPSESPPDTTFTTPGGSTSRITSPSISVVSGVNGEGLITSVFPASSAGAIFHTPSSSGKFHGVIAATTPSGRRRTSVRFSGVSDITSTGIWRPAVTWNQTAAPNTSPIASFIGLPCSRTSTGAMSPARALSASATSSSALRRTSIEPCHARSAAFDDSIAASSCARLHSGASANTSPVAGLITPKRPAPATALPSMVMVKSDMRGPPGMTREGTPCSRSGKTTHPGLVAARRRVIQSSMLAGVLGFTSALLLVGAAIGAVYGWVASLFEVAKVRELDPSVFGAGPVVLRFDLPDLPAHAATREPSRVSGGRFRVLASGRVLFVPRVYLPIPGLSLLNFGLFKGSIDRIGGVPRVSARATVGSTILARAGRCPPG